MKESMHEYAEKRQEGYLSGCYPTRLAEEIANEFCVSYALAIEVVFQVARARFQ
jgi:hypothetical protein